MIGQNDQFQGHEHLFDTVNHPGNDSDGGSWWNVTYKKKTEGICTDGINGTPRFGSETLSKGITVRYWKRTA